MSLSKCGATLILCIVQLFLVTLGVTSVTAEPPLNDNAARDLDMGELTRLLYEERNNPSFEGTVRFLTGVPLISADPSCLRESQYFTSILLWARQTTSARFNGQLSQIALSVLRDQQHEPPLRTKYRRSALDQIIMRVFGDQPTLTATLWGESDHPHPHLTSDPLRVASKMEVTSGLHMLRTMDERLRQSASQEQAIRELLVSSAVRWRIELKSSQSLRMCKKFIDIAVPFMLHRSDADFVVCGYAEAFGKDYWMAFDLSGLERKVTLGYTSGSVPFSRYKTLVAENQKRDKPLNIDPLFWDYKSYFSIENLAAFELIEAGAEESISVVYAEEFDDARAKVIAEEEIAKARELQMETVNKEEMQRRNVRETTVREDENGTSEHRP